MQQSDGVDRTGIRRLIARKLPFALGHDASQYLVKPLDAPLSDVRLNS
jgi:hypothetical protein